MVALKYTVLIISCIFLSVPLHSQHVLTVEDAVKIALENNYQIRVASNELRIREARFTPGFAGMLPTIAGNIVDNNSIQNLSQVRSDNSLVSRDNARNNSLNYGIGLDWTVFDGLRMFAYHKELKELEKLGEAELKQTVLAKVGEVMITYFDLVQQQQQLAALDSTIYISNQRVDLANNRFTIGKASKLEVLNAKVDLNTDETLRLRQHELYVNTKIQLNALLARDTKIEFSVIPEFLVDTHLILSELEMLVEQQNPQLDAQRINKRISELQLKQVKAGRFPTLIASTGYTISHSESSLGFTTSSDARGWSYGFGATLKIFDGFNQNRNEKISKIQIQNADLAIEQQSLELISQVGTAYQTYLTNIRLIELEEKNEAIAKENLDITVDKYRIGIIPTIEFRTAQLNYINARVRNSNAKFQAKLSEIILKQLAGNISL